MSSPHPAASDDEAIEAIVKRIVAAQLRIDPAVLTSETTWADLNAESMDLIDILMTIDETFSADLDFEGAEHLLKLGDVTAFLKRSGVVLPRDESGQAPIPPTHPPSL